jgi:hypothetical protein
MSKKEDFTKIKYSHLSKLYMSANGFKSTFENLKKQSAETLGIIQYENATPATATNGLFALELYLKLIYSFDYWEKTQRGNENRNNETQYPKGHKLYELFNQLEETSTRTILEKTLYEMSNDEVNEFFKNFSNDFAKWRYYFESSGCMEGDFYSLDIILTAVYDYCTDYVNHKMYMPKEWTENGSNTSVTMHKAKVSSLEELNDLQSKKLSELI